MSLVVSSADLAGTGLCQYTFWFVGPISIFLDARYLHLSSYVDVSPVQSESDKSDAKADRSKRSKLTAMQPRVANQPANRMIVAKNIFLYDRGNPLSLPTSNDEKRGGHMSKPQCSYSHLGYGHWLVVNDLKIIFSLL